MCNQFRNNIAHTAIDKIQPQRQISRPMQDILKGTESRDCWEATVNTYIKREKAKYQQIQYWNKLYEIKVYKKGC